MIDRYRPSGRLQRKGKTETKTEVLVPGLALSSSRREALTAYGYPKRAGDETGKSGAPPPS